MGVQVRDPRLAEIVDPGAGLLAISRAFQFTEGPVWHPGERHVIFSDIPADTMYRWSEAEGFSTFRKPSNMANGNTYDRQGRLLSCEHASSLVSRDDGERTVLASHFESRQLNSPNDIIVDKSGLIYFTDPSYGRMPVHGVERPRELDFQGVYRLDPESGELRLLTRDFSQPNGLCLSLDEQHLFVADTEQRHIRRFRLLPDGSLGEGEVFTESPAPDGLKTDSAGNLYTGGPKGVYIYHAADGSYLGRIATPDFCANFCWMGDDLQELFLTASGSVYRIQVKIPGLPLF